MAKYKGVYTTSSGKYYYATKIKVDGVFKSVKSKLYDNAKSCYADLNALKAGTLQSTTSQQQVNNKSTIETSEAVKSNPKTLEDVENDFYNSIKNTMKINTLTNTKSRIKMINLHLDKNMLFKDIATMQTISEFQEALSKGNKKNSSLNMIRSTFLGIAKVAFYEGEISQTQYGLIQMSFKHYANEPKKETQFYTKEDFKKYLSVIDNPTYQLIFTILFYCGLRIGELLGLQAKCFKDNTLIIKQQRNNSGIILNHTKSLNGVRKVNLSKNLANQIKEYIEKNKLMDDDLLFSISRTLVTHKNEYYAKKANLPKIKLHGFRHSCCSLFIQTYLDNNLAVNFKLIAKYLGDTTEMILEVYSHLYNTDDTSIIEQMEKEVA